MKALVIDDSRAIRLILKTILEELGFETFEAGDGLEALTRMKEVGSIDLALVDWNMPHMDGYEFVRAVRGETANDAMRLMMVTTEAEMEQVAKALEAGANEYVMKPFTRDTIVDKLDLMGIEHSGHG